MKCLWFILFNLFIGSNVLAETVDKKFLEQHPKAVAVNLSYAKKFSAFVDNESSLVHVKGNKEDYCYFRSHKIEVLKDCVKLPSKINQVSSTSTTHLFPLWKLNFGKKIVGFSNKKLIYPGLIKESEVVELGFPIDVERLITSKTELLFTYSLGSDRIEGFNKVPPKSVILVHVHDFLESNPLAKMEWLKFFGLVLNRFSEADLFYQANLNRYRQLKKMAVKNNVVVMIGEPMGNKFSAPSEKSDVVQLVEDAGGKYLFKGMGKGRLSISSEKLISISKKASIWLPQGRFSTKKELASSAGYIEKLSVFKNGRIYNNSKRVAENGANDFWQNGIYRPDLVLNDLIQIFKNSENFEKNLVWYKRLK